MKYFIKVWVIASVVAALAGCTTYTEYESYTGVAAEPDAGSFTGAITEDYARSTEQGIPAPVDDSGNTIWVDFGNAKVQIYPPRVSKDVLASGPVVPIFPDEQEKVEYGEDTFYVALRVVPLDSVITFDPSEFAISVEGVDGPITPIKVVDSLGDRHLLHPDANYSRQWVYGTQRWYWIWFDIKIGDVDRFTLIPGPMELDGNLYVFPEIVYEPFVHKDMR